MEVNKQVNRVEITVAEESFKAAFEGIAELEEFYIESVETALEAAYPNASISISVRNQSEDTVHVEFRPGSFSEAAEYETSYEDVNGYEDEQDSVKRLLDEMWKVTLTEANNRTHLMEQNV